jgi:hypothetical protein
VGQDSNPDILENVRIGILTHKIALPTTVRSRYTPPSSNATRPTACHRPTSGWGKALSASRTAKQPSSAACWRLREPALPALLGRGVQLHRAKWLLGRPLRWGLRSGAYVGPGAGHRARLLGITWREAANRGRLSPLCILPQPFYSETNVSECARLVSTPPGQGLLACWRFSDRSSARPLPWSQRSNPYSFAPYGLCQCREQKQRRSRVGSVAVQLVLCFGTAFAKG